MKEAVKNRNKAKTNHSFNNLMVNKRVQTKVKRIIRKSKRSYWKEYCGNIGVGIKVNEI